MIKRITAFVIFLCAVISADVHAQTDTTDITGLGGVLRVQYSDASTVNSLKKAFDNDISSLFTTYHDSVWIEYQVPGYYVVTKYTITSGTQSVNRDPNSMILKGSLDGINWTTLDSLEDQNFSGRLEKKEFTVSNTSKGYMNFRIYLTTKSGTTLQFGEMEFLGIPEPDGSTAAPASPSGFAAEVVSSKQINLTWTDNSSDESYFKIERSPDSASWALVSVASKNIVSYSDSSLTENSPYYYRMCAVNGTGSSDYVYSLRSRTQPIETWKEHWYEHNQLVKRVFFDKDVAVYFDDQMDTTQTWLFKFVGDIWRYAKKNYGFDPEHLLYVILHEDRYGGGHPFYSYDSDHDNRTGIDVALGGWTEKWGDPVEIPIHETGHVVESMSFKSYSSPAFGLWGDSKFMEIYNYDLYLALGMTANANDAYSRYMNSKDDFPQAGSRWFRNWFYPIYRDHGKTQVLVKFFKLMSENFPKSGQMYTRDMNYGEFFHFWSGAAGVNLKAQATLAFGWTAEFESQFNKARADFPNVVYDDIAVEDNAPAEVVTSYELSQNYPNPFNPSTVINYQIVKGSKVSLKVFDVLGNEVATLVDEFKPAGAYSAHFNAGQNIAAGIYFYRLTAGSFTQTKKMIFLK